MKAAIYQIAYRVGMHPNDLGKAVREGEITGEVPDGNAQSKDAWVDLHSLRNYVEWQYEKKQIDELRYQKSIRRIDVVLRKGKIT